MSYLPQQNTFLREDKKIISCRFSAGNSIFQSKGMNSDGNLELLGIEGPIKGQTVTVSRKGATFGRSSENTVCVPDRELSRKHSRIDFDDKFNKFVVYDMNSTNGTYIQLVGELSSYTPNRLI